MAMTPDEIREQSFPSVRKGGLDPEAVADYLTHIANEVVRLQDEVSEAQQALESATPGEVAPVAPSPAPAPPRTIVGPRVDELLEAAQRSADGIVSDAEAWATEHMAKADTYAQDVRSEVDELRQTTETQAESFRQETVEYANRIREDAETATALARSQAETDLTEQYDRLVADVSARVEKVQASEHELLAQLNVTKSALDSATSHFQTAVDAHSEPTITRHSESWDELTGAAAVADEPPADADPGYDSLGDHDAIESAGVGEDDGQEWPPSAEDAHKPVDQWQSTSAVGETTEVGEDDGPQWPTSAGDAHKPVDQWESASDEVDAAPAPEDSRTDTWSEETSIDHWSPEAVSNDESGSPTDWPAAGSAEPWQADQSTPEQPRGAASDDPWGGPSDEGRSSFFTSLEESDASSPENDPLSTMVREAVERVTDGPGNN